jgi:hypothetical protein
VLLPARVWWLAFLRKEVAFKAKTMIAKIAKVFIVVSFNLI